jgi:hypothetical protein
MITGGSCPHPLYRITGVSSHRRAAAADFAEALLPGHFVIAHTLGKCLQTR